VTVQDPFAEEHPADDQLLIPNEGLVGFSYTDASCWFACMWCGL